VFFFFYSRWVDIEFFFFIAGGLRIDIESRSPFFYSRWVDIESRSSFL
jgi:hypothetical protein